MEAAGPSLDFLARTKGGVNAPQLARARRAADGSSSGSSSSSSSSGSDRSAEAAVQLLERATEAQAAAAQEALLRELEAEQVSSNTRARNGTEAYFRGSTSTKPNAC